jgi:AcrR family transcriptional regulator
MDTPAAKSDLTLSAIVDAALDMAAAQGMESLSLGEVAKRLAMSKSGVFSRVGSREALQQAVLDEYERRFTADVFTPAMAQPRGLPRLDAIVQRWLQRVCNLDEHMGCLYVAGAFEYDDRIDSAMRARIHASLLRWRGVLRRTVVQALDCGHLRPDTQPDQFVFELYSLMVGLMHDARFLRDPQSPEHARCAYERLVTTYRSLHHPAR